MISNRKRMPSLFSFLFDFHCLLRPFVHQEQKRGHRRMCNKKNHLKFYFSIFFLCICFSSESFAHGSHYSEKEIETARSVFEKAILLSPEFIEQTDANSVVPFYKYGGHKIYLTDGFWNLTRAWLRIYIQELENYCPCDLDPELMIQTAKKHTPQNFFKQKAVRIKNASRSFSYEATQLAAQYGYTMAVLQLSFEMAEAVFFTFVGLPGLHAACNLGNLAAIFLVRKFQKYIRTFSYGKELSNSRLIFSLRMAWLSRQIRKSQNKVFFIIKEALDFNEESLESVNKKGPKGHRLLWLNKLKQKTDPLFEKISLLEEELYNLEEKSEKTAGEGFVGENKIEQRKKRLKKQIEKLKNKISHLFQMNRLSFFGSRRFKKHLFLKSRKKHFAYMTGHGLSDTIIGQKKLWFLTLHEPLWPLALQENILEQVLNNKEQPHSLQTEPDEIQKGLTQEFLSRRHANTDTLFKGEEQVVYSLLESIERIFDTKTDIATRMMITQSIERTLAVLFFRYLKISLPIIEKKYSLSYTELIKLNWNFGHFFRSVYEFSDFLNSVSITKNKDKIKFYKYEAMEKLLAFLDYLYEVQTLLTNTQAGKEELFNRLQARQQHLASLSLLKNKKTAFSLVPFKKAQAQCKKLVEKNQ